MQVMCTDWAVWWTILICQFWYFTEGETNRAVHVVREHYGRSAKRNRNAKSVEILTLWSEYTETVLFRHTLFMCVNEILRRSSVESVKSVASCYLSILLLLVLAKRIKTNILCAHNVRNKHHSNTISIHPLKSWNVHGTKYENGDAKKWK